MKILVTGAAGFIGYHLVKALVQRGHDVIGVDNINDYYDVNLKYARLADSGISKKAISENRLARSSIYTNYAFQKSDIVDLLILEKLFEEQQFSHVLHMAAQPGVRYSLENPHAYVQSNVVGFVNILESCRHYHIKHLVYASSSSIYGENGKVPFSEDDRVDNPVSLYAATKKSNELMAYTYSHLYRLPTSGLRFFTVYGPWGRPDMAPILFAMSISENRPISVFNNGEMSRDFTFIDDIINGILISMDNPPIGEGQHPPYQLINVGNGSPVALMEFIETMEEHLNRAAKKQMMPMQPGDVPRTWADTSRLQTFGYQSKVSIDRGVEEFIKWFKKYYKK